MTLTTSTMYGSEEHKDFIRKQYICSSCEKSITENDPAFENNMCNSCYELEFIHECHN